ncbi:MAG: DUF5320 domain-containing protein [Chloroflexi bacterium]|nr:DUF5320 domain-containing protein [Chloroflexota bacterium]
MPFGDGTGPRGLGPMTGRGAGFCGGFARPGFANPIPGGWLRGSRGPYGYPYYGAGYGPPSGYPYGYPHFGPGYAPYSQYPYSYPRWR